MKAIYTITKEEVISLIGIIKALEYGIDKFTEDSIKSKIYSAINGLCTEDRLLFKQISYLLQHNNLEIKLETCK